jgi:Tol biopolymer transport system component
LLALGVLLVLVFPAVAAPRSHTLAPLDWWPVPSPDGSHIAFTRVYLSRMELEVLSPLTGRAVQVGGSAGQLSPTWSPDGKLLAYASGGVLWEVRADGTGRHRYVAPTRAFAPAWRPLSTQLAYLTTHGAQNTDLWVAGALWARNVIGRPSWSPDGSAVAFQRDGGIYVARAPGEERQLAAVANPGAPVWSRDGKTIAYAAGSVLFRVPADGSAPPQSVANALSEAGTPSWRFDDARLAVPWRLGVSVIPLAGPGVGGQGTLVRNAQGSGGVAYLRSGALLAPVATPGCASRMSIALFTGARSRPLTPCA